MCLQFGFVYFGERKSAFKICWNWQQSPRKTLSDFDPLVSSRKFDNKKRQESRAVRTSSSFKLIKDLKFFFYGEEDFRESDARFGDIVTVNVTHAYSDAISPDGVMIQMTQNFFTWVASPLFWLVYIPFYERLYPIFGVQESNVTTTTVNRYSYKFNLRKCVADCGRNFNEKTHEISFGRLANLLRAFANFFDTVRR